MITISATLGNIFHDNEWIEKFNKATQNNNFETLKLSRTDLSKNRLRAITNKGTDVGIVLKSDSKIQNGDVLLSDKEKFIFIQQNPEKVISVTKKQKTEANFDDTLVLIGHILGNHHRPIEIKNEKIFFPILSESELEIFKQLFSNIIDKIELQIEERIFEPHGELKTHEH
ncbi:MAG: urease accessory protein UreE [Nitrosopumilaceae archaeon]